jgi:serine/threonine protein phosphatase PrpC
MFMDIPEEQCKAVFLCTDGVADDFDDVQKRDEFVRGYLEYTMSRPCELATLDTVEMLTNWPVPKHTDDKTIACMYRKEDSDGRRRG